MNGTCCVFRVYLFTCLPVYVLPRPEQALEDGDDNQRGKDGEQKRDMRGEEQKDSIRDDGFKSADDASGHDDGGLGVGIMRGAFFKDGGEIHPGGGVDVEGREHEG